MVLSGSELADLQDRLFQVRCAAEDISTAVTDGAAAEELHKVAGQVVELAAELERIR